MEVARQLGNFATAKKFLKFRFPKDVAHAVAVIKKLILEKNSAVQEIVETPDAPRPFTVLL